MDPTQMLELASAELVDHLPQVPDQSVTSGGRAEVNDALAEQVVRDILARRFDRRDELVHLAFEPLLRGTPRRDLRTLSLSFKNVSHLDACRVWRTALGLAGYAGLRLGEIRALTWSDVDLAMDT